MLEIIDGDLLNCDAPIICHQCNCVTNRASGLAFSLFGAYPWADVYHNRTTPSKPGDICVREHQGKTVVNMFAQYYGGGPCGTKPKMDYKGMRECWFLVCLRKLYTHSQGMNTKIAFPYLIGCGVARGTWDNYYRMLTIFNVHTDNEVVIIRKVESG